MSFRSIGVLADEVLREAGLRAAAAKNSAAGIAGGSPAGRERDEPPTLYADAPATSGSSVKGPRRVKASGVTAANREVAKPRGELILVVCNDGCWLPMPPRRDFARPGQHLSLRIVGGRAHATLP